MPIRFENTADCNKFDIKGLDPTELVMNLYNAAKKLGDSPITLTYEEVQAEIEKKENDIYFEMLSGVVPVVEIWNETFTEIKRNGNDLYVRRLNGVVLDVEIRNNKLYMGYSYNNLNGSNYLAESVIQKTRKRALFTKLERKIFKPSAKAIRKALFHKGNEIKPNL